MRPLVFLLLASACAGSSSPAAEISGGDGCDGRGGPDGREVELLGLQAEVADYER